MYPMQKKNRVRVIAIAGVCLAALFLYDGQVFGEVTSLPTLEQGGLLQVKVHRLIVEPISEQPVIILTDLHDEAAMPIWIGRFEANAIHSEIEKIRHRRPLTHDLLERIMDKVNLKIKRVVITNLRDGIYYARILMEMKGSSIEIDARPSDSIVMALKSRAPIFVAESLFKSASISLTEKEKIEKEYGLTIQSLTPELARAFSYDSTKGILVSDVQKGSKAQKDGLRRGDIFVEVGGLIIQDVTGMREALGKTPSPAKAKIFRKSHFRYLTIHPH